ncbi:hypothetical protein ACHAPP_008726, partial [Verticillium nonalfalfae]
MKVLSQEEERAHYNVVLKGGAIGGTLGLVGGLAGTMFASRRYPAFRALTLPFRTFLVTSTATFGAIVNADRESIKFAHSKDPMYGYQDASQRARELAHQNESAQDAFMRWGRTNRYGIVFGSWIAFKGGAIGGTLGLVGGLAGTMFASRRYPAFRALTLPFRTFLVT